MDEDERLRTGGPMAVALQFASLAPGGVGMRHFSGYLLHSLELACQFHRIYAAGTGRAYDGWSDLNLKQKGNVASDRISVYYIKNLVNGTVTLLPVQELILSLSEVPTLQARVRVLQGDKANLTSKVMRLEAEARQTQTLIADKDRIIKEGHQNELRVEILAKRNVELSMEVRTLKEHWTATLAALETSKEAYARAVLDYTTRTAGGVLTVAEKKVLEDTLASLSPAAPAGGGSDAELEAEKLKTGEAEGKLAALHAKILDMLGYMDGDRWTGPPPLDKENTFKSQALLLKNLLSDLAFDFLLPNQKKIVETAFQNIMQIALLLDDLDIDFTPTIPETILIAPILAQLAGTVYQSGGAIPFNGSRQFLQKFTGGSNQITMEPTPNKPVPFEVKSATARTFAWADFAPSTMSLFLGYLNLLGNIVDTITPTINNISDPTQQLVHIEIVRDKLDNLLGTAFVNLTSVFPTFQYQPWDTTIPEERMYSLPLDKLIFARATLKFLEDTGKEDLVHDCANLKNACDQLWTNVKDNKKTHAPDNALLKSLGYDDADLAKFPA